MPKIGLFTTLQISCIYLVLLNVAASQEIQSDSFNDLKKFKSYKSELRCGAVRTAGMFVPFRREPQVVFETKISGDYGYLMYDYDKVGNKINGWVDSQGKSHFFCTPDIIGTEPCPDESSLNKPIIDGSLKVDNGLGDHIKYAWANSNGRHTLHVKNTGYYCVQIVCEDFTKNFAMNIFEFNSAHGLIPPEMFPLKPLNGWMILAYGLSFVAFLILAYRNRRVIIVLQRHIGSVLGASFIESLFAWIHLFHLNKTGKHSSILLGLSTIFSSLRATLSLLFLLLAAIGFGVTFPTLELRMKRYITILTIAHGVAAILDALSIFYTSKSRRGVQEEMLLTLPILFTSSIFSTWIFIALPVTTRTLISKRQTVKAAMYEQVSRILFVSFLLTVVVILLSLGLVSTYSEGPSWRSKNWHSLWFYQSGASSFIRLMSTCLIAFVFRPQSDNRASYGLQEISGDADLEGDTKREGMHIDGTHFSSQSSKKERSGFDDTNSFSLHELGPSRQEAQFQHRNEASLMTVGGIRVFGEDADDPWKTPSMQK